MCKAASLCYNTIELADGTVLVVDQNGFLL